MTIEPRMEWIPILKKVDKLWHHLKVISALESFNTISERQIFFVKLPQKVLKKGELSHNFIWEEPNHELWAATSVLSKEFYTDVSIIQQAFFKIFYLHSECPNHL